MYIGIEGFCSSGRIAEFLRHSTFIIRYSIFSYNSLCLCAFVATKSALATEAVLCVLVDFDHVFGDLADPLTEAVRREHSDLIAIAYHPPGDFTQAVHVKFHQG